MDWVYLSPILTAEEGSDRGTTSRTPPRLMLRAAAPKGSRRSPKRHGKPASESSSISSRITWDASPPQNAWWWSLLKEGKASRYAEAFDVDWDFGGGKLRLPVLGSDDDLDKLEVVDGELRYFDHASRSQKAATPRVMTPRTSMRGSTTSWWPGPTTN